MNTRQFFDALFANALDNAAILLWTSKGERKISTWCHTVEDAATYVPGWPDRDVYFGVLPVKEKAARKAGAHRRAAEPDRSALTCLWLDLDYGAEGHAKPNLPPDEAAALALLAEMPIEPSIVVRSGYGLHAYWLLREPLMLTDGGLSVHAKGHVAGWQSVMKIRAKAHGWEVDSVHDLSRVLRVPGSLNHKSATPRVCEVIEANGKRHDLHHFEEYIPDDVSIGTPDVDTHPVDLPRPQFDALMELDLKFAASWRRERPDLTDQSVSGYSMSLASIAAHAGWSEPEIAALVRAFHAECGVPHKAHDSRVRHTVAAAVKSAANSRQRLGARSAQNAAAVADPQPQHGEAQEQPDARVALLARQLGVPLVSVQRFEGDATEYRLGFEDGAKAVIPGRDMPSQRTFGATVFDASGKLPLTYKADEWKGIIEALAIVATPRDTGPESREGGRVQSWLSDCLGGKEIPVVPKNEQVTVDLFQRDDHTYLRAKVIARYLRNTEKPIPTETVAKALSDAGAPFKKFRKNGGNPIQYWDVTPILNAKPPIGRTEVDVAEGGEELCTNRQPATQPATPQTND